MPSTRDDVIDGVSTSTGLKAPVACGTIANITLFGYQTINGVVIGENTVNKRVLVKNQTDPIENGIYDQTATAWVRSPDFSGARDVRCGTLVLIATPSVPNARVYRVTSADLIDIGTDAINFTAVEEFGLPIDASQIIVTPNCVATDVLQTMLDGFCTLIADLQSQITALTASTGTDITTLEGEIDTLTTTLNNLLAALASVPDFGTITIRVVANETIRLLTKSPIGFSITHVITQADSGTCSAEVQIDGVALGGGSNAASASEVDVTHASANAVAIGQNVDLVTSSNAACLMLNVTLKISRSVP